MNDKDNNEKKLTKFNPNDTETSGSNPIWPGQGLRKPGEEIKEDNGDNTEVPLVR